MGKDYRRRNSGGVFWAGGLALGTALAGWLAFAPAPGGAQTAAAPGRFEWGAEWRGRAEASWVEGADSLYLNRVRAHVSFAPTRWLRFRMEGQDAAAAGLAGSGCCAGVKDRFDLRLAQVEFGRGEAGFSATFGRQELSVGEERLLGADSFWDALGPTYDGARAGYAAGAWQAAAFVGIRVEPGPERPDRRDPAARIAGLTLRWKNDAAELEPYLLWKRGGGSFDLSGRAGHRNVFAPGLRAAGDLAGGLDYNVEMALARGRVVGDSLSGWAGHWEMGWNPAGHGQGPRVALEYNYASGDRDPYDGRQQTFDDLYPAGFNKFGLADPFAWRNIRYPAAGLDFPATRRLTLHAGCRAFWLATRQDGLYPGGDEYAVRNPQAATSHIGDQCLVSADYERPGGWRVSAGYGRLFRGGFLAATGYAPAWNAVYILTRYQR